MGSAPALCRGSLHGHCARRMLRSSRLHAQPLRPASSVRTMPGGAGLGRAGASAGGAGGFAAAGRGLGAPGARCWKLPSAAGCTTPGCGRGRGAPGGRACVRRGCWPRRRPAGLSGRALEAGGGVLRWADAGEWRRARDRGIRVGAKGTGRCAQGDCCVCRLRSPITFPGDPDPTPPSPSALEASSIPGGLGGAPLAS